MIGGLPAGPGRREPEPPCQSLQLELGLGCPIAQPLRGYLRVGHDLASRAQSRLDLSLLRGAGRQLRRHLLAGCAVVAELLLERDRGLLEGLRSAAQGRREALGARRSCCIGLLLRAQPLDPRKPLGALAPALLCLPALCGELTLELCLAHRQRPLCRSRGALLDQPFGATAGLPQRGRRTHVPGPAKRKALRPRRRSRPARRTVL